MNPIMSLEQARDEVDAFRDYREKPIDERIRSLVIGLRRWGVKTTMSCEGHFFSGHRFPWVDIAPENLSLVARLLMVNYRQPGYKTLWMIEPTANPRIRSLKGGYLHLPSLKREAERLGRLLQELPDDYFEEKDAKA